MSFPLDSVGAPASRRAAVIKRGAEREKRDLFAERDEDAPVSMAPPSQAPSSMREGPPSSFSGGVGARNENSVLFRVDQLALGRVKTPIATPAVVASTPEPRSGEDEGVIDLKALGSTGARPPVAPLFSEPPPVTLEVDERARPNARPTSRLAIAGGIAGGVLVLAAAIFGISIAFRGEEPVKRAAAAVVAPPPPPPSAPATQAPPPPPPADRADPPAKEAKVKKGRGRGKGKASVSAGVASKPAGPKDPCGCKGDFNCILACSAKGAM
jgi:hypothetical protein